MGKGKERVVQPRDRCTIKTKSTDTKVCTQSGQKEWSKKVYPQSLLSTFRLLSVADIQTGEQYSRRGKTNERKQDKFTFSSWYIKAALRIIQIFREATDDTLFKWSIRLNFESKLMPNMVR